MARPPTATNGSPALAAGYYVDRHGHRVFACERDLLPACPRHPFAHTVWTLERHTGCRREEEERRR